MKTVIKLVIPILGGLVLLWGLARARNSDIQSEQMVRRVISSGAYSGWDDKEFSQMGDAAAFDVAKILSGEKVSEQEAQGALLVLQLAFSSPKLVVNTDDREPRATLFVLRGLEATASPVVRQQIAEARRLILANYQRYKATQ